MNNNEEKYISLIKYEEMLERFINNIIRLILGITDKGKIYMRIIINYNESFFMKIFLVLLT